MFDFKKIHIIPPNNAIDKKKKLYYLNIYPVLFFFCCVLVFIKCMRRFRMSRKCEILEENEEGNCDTNRVIINIGMDSNI